MPQGVTQLEGESHIPKIDLYFPVRGQNIPVDHGYPLYAALSRLLEVSGDRWLHEEDQIGIHPIRGRYIGQGRLALGPWGRLGIRLPAGLIPRLLPLAGRQLRLGDDVLRLGIPQPVALTPASRLYAHLVTTRNGHEETRFDGEIGRQLAALGVHATVERGPRRVFQVRERTVVGYFLKVSDLSEKDSVRLQEHGLGGRRKLGCGLFLPLEG